MKALLEYARKRGWILDNPAADIARKKKNQPDISVPTREQFKALVEAIRNSDGRADSQAKAKAGGDLVETAQGAGALAPATAPSQSSWHRLGCSPT